MHHNYEKMPCRGCIYFCWACQQLLCTCRLSAMLVLPLVWLHFIKNFLRVQVSVTPHYAWCPYQALLSTFAWFADTGSKFLTGGTSCSATATQDGLVLTWDLYVLHNGSSWLLSVGNYHGSWLVFYLFVDSSLSLSSWDSWPTMKFSWVCVLHIVLLCHIYRSRIFFCLVEVRITKDPNMPVELKFSAFYFFQILVL